MTITPQTHQVGFIGLDFAPGFFVRHVVKDMGIALEEAGHMGGDYRGLISALAQIQGFAEEGGAEAGTQGIFRRYVS